MNKPVDIDEYIDGFPKDIQKMLELVRETIKKTAPDAKETISYAMPAFTLNGRNLVYFAGFKNHIGFYPAPVGMEAFKQELSGYKTGRGSVQFPLDKPIPLELIAKIVKFRMNYNVEQENKSRKKQ
ncbi:MAG TPA: DUF1801 domain-containing protein [Bacteroidales bacterium]